MYFYRELQPPTAAMPMHSVSYTQRAIKVVPPVILDESVQVKMDIGPIVVMSGFLTKRTHTLNRWKQRWWQLLDNGILLYFKNDNRLKLLGEIDIARTCYDVRLGAEKCRASFPRVAPSCCCLSFAVLKRTYYMYAPTADEANQWAQSITKTSRVLNRRIVAGVERRRAPEPPGPPRPPSCPPNFRINRLHLHTQAFSISDSMEELENERLYENGNKFARSKRMASSVPDYLDQIAHSPSPIFSPKRNGSQLSITFSSSSKPPKQDSATTSPLPAAGYDSNSDAHSRTTSPSLRLSSSYSNMSASMFASYSHKLDALPETTFAEDDEEGGTMPRANKRRKRVSLPPNFLRDFQLLESKEAQIRKKLREFDLPPRPATTTPGFSSSAYTYQPPRQTRPRQTSFGGEYSMQHPTGSGSRIATKQKHFSKSSDHLANRPYSKPRSRRTATAAQVAPERPVPKPRKLKGAPSKFSEAEKQKKEPAFVRATRILHVYPSTPSPSSATETHSDMENSVSVTTAKFTVASKAVSFTSSPPPRPRKDSGPPTFVPLPPRRDSGPPTFVPTPPPGLEVLDTGSDLVASPTFT